MIIAKIPGYDDYLATKCGKVLSLKNRRVRVMKPTVGGRGYPLVQLWQEGRGSMVHVHSAVLSAFVSERPDGMQCRHLNGDPTDNRLENLRWGTWHENHEDKVRHGHASVGEKHGMAKLSDGEVAEIRFLRSSGWKFVPLAKKFGIAVSHCHRICTGENR